MESGRFFLNIFCKHIFKECLSLHFPPQPSGYKGKKQKTNKLISVWSKLVIYFSILPFQIRCYKSGKEEKNMVTCEEWTKILIKKEIKWSGYKVKWDCRLKKKKKKTSKELNSPFSKLSKISLLILGFNLQI